MDDSIYLKPWKKCVKKMYPIYYEFCMSFESDLNSSEEFCGKTETSPDQDRSKSKHLEQVSVKTTTRPRQSKLNINVTVTHLGQQVSQNTP